MLAFLTPIDVDSHKGKRVLLLRFDSTSYPLSLLDLIYNMHVGEIIDMIRDGGLLVICMIVA